MIATLRGEITEIEENALVLETGGVGLRVFVPKPLLTRLRTGESALLHTHLVVRENELALYGFESASDRNLFVTLLGVDGVGPKMALAVLSTLNLETVQRAVFNEEPELPQPRAGRGTQDRPKDAALPERPSPARKRVGTGSGHVGCRFRSAGGADRAGLFGHRGAIGLAVHPQRRAAGRGGAPAAGAGVLPKTIKREERHAGEENCLHRAAAQWAKR